MARTVKRKLVGRTITRAQLDGIIEAVKRKFRPPARHSYSIFRGSDSDGGKSLEAAVRLAGSPTIVRKFSIKVTSDQRQFEFDVRRKVIKVKVAGEDDYFAAGFYEEIARILDPQPTVVSRTLTRPVHLTLRCVLTIGALAAITMLIASQDLDWNGATTYSTLALLALFSLGFIEQRVSSYVLFTAGAKERWKRTEKITLAGVVATICVGLFTNGVNLAINSSRSSADSKSASSASPYTSKDDLSDRTPKPSRDSARERLTEISVTGNTLPWSTEGTATLTGRGFTPGEDVEVTVGTDEDPLVYRANSKGEIGPETLRVESMRNGKVEVKAIGSESRLPATFVYRGQ
ncbi:hypothetical protein ACFV5E_30165 [Streptomyces chartreusis]|uniref:hypothetical protein n=1 Tax=Streptomyces chartreusis TaxID=1969 RepID=UPI003677B64C